MKEEIRIFKNEIFGEIRTAGTSEEPMFCLADVCDAIGIANARNVKARLDAEDVRLIDTPTTSGTQSMTFVNESGLYDTILRSDSVKAKPFRKWVTSEVLPSIRKHGAYATPATIESIIADPDMGIKLLEALKEEREKAKASEQRALAAESEVLSLSKEIEEMQPKVSYYDKILQSVNCVTTTQIAQDYGVSAKAFNQLLKELNIQRKVNDQWILFAKYLGQGYTKSKSIAIRMRNGEDATVLHTYWTQKGRLFLYDILKQNNVLPLMDIDND